jgi:hypothetical protein
MAKISLQIEMDTEEGTMDVSINGKSVPNANYVSCHKYYNSYEEENEVGCNISCSEKDEENGIVKNTSYYSDSSEQANAIPKEEAIRSIAGFIGVKDIDPTHALVKFFESKSRFK